MLSHQEKRKRELEKQEKRESRKKAKVGPLGVQIGEDKEGFVEVPIDEYPRTLEGPHDESDEEEEEYKPKTPDEIAEVNWSGEKR